jgi:hypothetical protein
LASRNLPPARPPSASIWVNAAERLGEEIAQQVGDAECDPEGVRVVAGAQERREDLLAEEAEQPRDERHRRHEPRRLRDLRRLLARLDLHGSDR